MAPRWMKQNSESHGTQWNLLSAEKILVYLPQVFRCSIGLFTCVKVEDVGSLPLHSHRHVVPLHVGGTDPPVRQLNLEKPPAALHAVERHVVETRLDVRFIGVEGVVEDVLHDLQGGK